MTSWEVYAQAHVAVCDKCDNKAITKQCFKKVQAAWYDFRAMQRRGMR